MLKAILRKAILYAIGDHLEEFQHYRKNHAMDILRLEGKIVEHANKATLAQGKPD